MQKLLKKLSNVRYMIDIKGTQRVAHINQLKKFYGKIVNYHSHILTYRHQEKKRKRSCNLDGDVELRRSERIKRQKDNQNMQN